jgi:hypothetical protein
VGGRCEACPVVLARLEVVNYPEGDLCGQLAHAGTETLRAGLVIGSGGNLSARAPGSEADSVELAHKRAVNLDEAAPTTYAALLLARGQPVPRVPARFLEAVGRNEAHI